MPLIAEFQFTREIEDRLLAPIEIGWLAVEKVIAGMIQAMVAGLVVIPLAWLVLRPGVEYQHRHSADLRGGHPAGGRLFRLRRAALWDAAWASSRSA